MSAPDADRHLREFVDGHLRAVWRYLRAHGAAPDEADDLTQETFVTALGRGVADLDRAAARVFLQRTARFTFLHHLRDRRRDAALADAVDELWTREAADDGGDELVERVRACVDRLDGRPRRAVELAYGLGDDEPLPRDEVARALDLRPNGLKTLLQRARALLRECLERRPR